jgi:hypothetical protein
MDAPDVNPTDDNRLARLARASTLALDAKEYADVPPDVVAKLRPLCLGLPESVENQAWAGFQWRIRKRTFAHLLTVDFADGPVTVLTFRSAEPELEALLGGGHPFFRPAWGKDVVGMVLDADAGWDEIIELVTESYCILAPKRLAELARRPTG